MLAVNARRQLAGKAQRAVPLVRVHVQGAAQARAFWNVSLPVLSSPGGAHITKYQIVKEYKDGVTYDDFLLALPEKDQLAAFTKEVPLFLRYLKVVTDADGRPEDFTEFMKRAKSGLVVESDVFITTEELLAVMWKNGYSEQECNAIQLTFPSDYKFHYPELAVLFNLAEEDTYKYCMRTRMEQSHIGELQFDKVKRKGFIRDHWLIFGTGIMIFKWFPFFNYYFCLKVFGTSLVGLTAWMGVNRSVASAFKKAEYMAAQKTAADVIEGQDAVVTAMQRFANDAKCVEYLSEFKGETEAKVASYKTALVMKMKEDLTAAAAKQLQAIATFEAGMSTALQSLVVTEAAASFKEAFPGDASLQSMAFSAAVKNLSGEAVPTSEDPVASYFEDAFASLAGADLATVTGDPAGSLAERVAYAQQTKEAEFKTTFMVTPAEVAEVKALVGEAGADYDFSKLSEASGERLDSLYASINAKVGYSLPADVGTKAIPASSDASTSSYIDSVNAQLESINGTLRTARLKAFAQAFA
mmetsp:Transcript_132970/g.234331  ORF Transcript_132970/g.234331 Transcript_132970/m.234331 type:complete len:527 (+) Transcript_132970:86-1666(+)